MAKKRCKYCRCLFALTKRNPDQKYCYKPDRQSARKRRWQRSKVQLEQACRLNKRASDQRWCARKPDYWNDYRESNTDYTRSNREKQRHRTDAGGPSSPFPAKLQRWTHYQLKTTTYQAVTALVLFIFESYN